MLTPTVILLPILVEYSQKLSRQSFFRAREWLDQKAVCTIAQKRVLQIIR